MGGAATSFVGELGNSRPCAARSRSRWLPCRPGVVNMNDLTYSLGLRTVEGDSMAQRTMLVCDMCGSAPADTVTFRVDNRNLQKDFCARHLAELIKDARTPRRGRKPKAISAPSSRSTKRAVRGRKKAP